MPTILPTDVDNNPIPAVRLKDGGAHSIAVTAASARNTAAFDADTRIVSLFATGPVFLRFGGASVTAAATDHYFPGGVYYDFSIGGERTAQYSHVAVIRADQDCTLYISEKE